MTLVRQVTDPLRRTTFYTMDKERLFNLSPYNSAWIPLSRSVGGTGDGPADVWEDNDRSTRRGDQDEVR